MNPLVSVIMPAYNAERWIAEAIDSILNQTYDNIELLIYDDGSTDKTLEIIMGYANKYFMVPREFTKVMAWNDFEGKNLGVTVALNRLIGACKGKYIARMDADDIAMPTRIEDQVRYIKYWQKCAGVGCEIELFGDENKNKRRDWWGDVYINTETIQRKLPYRNPLCHPSMLFYGDTLREYMYEGGVFQDYDLFLRMASDGKLFSKVPQMLMKYRVRSDSVAAVAESNWAEIKLKLRFLAKKFPRWNKFDIHVMRSIWQLIR